jgi:thioredoxin
MENILTDENFDKEINAQDKLVLVDFFATWCEPCTILGPILERVAEHFKEKIVLIKANVDSFPVAAQKYGAERIPAVILFKNGKPINGFVGLIPEKAIKEWLENILCSEYAKANGFQLNPDKKAVERIINGLLANENKYGQKYCPCRRVSGNKEEDAKKICPCFWHKDEIKKDGHCLCNLYVK